MKRFFALILCLAALSWSGCTEKKETGSTTPSLLIGLWEVSKYYDGEYNLWDNAFGADYGYFVTYEFRTDGSCLLREEAPAESYIEEEAYRYTVRAETLTLTGTDLDDGRETMRIEQLTEQELVLSESYEGETGTTCTDKLYLIRIR